MDIKSNTRTPTHTLTQMSSSDVDPRHNPGILTTCDKDVEALDCQHNNMIVNCLTHAFIARR